MIDKIKKHYLIMNGPNHGNRFRGTVDHSNIEDLARVGYSKMGNK